MFLDKIVTEKFEVGDTVELFKIRPTLVGVVLSRRKNLYSIRILSDGFYHDVETLQNINSLRRIQ